jgi:hypothetical protein
MPWAGMGRQETKQNADGPYDGVRTRKVVRRLPTSTGFAGLEASAASNFVAASRCMLGNTWELVIQGGADLRVPEPSLHHLRMHARREQQRGRRMPQVMEANARQVRVVQQWLGRIGVEVAASQRRARRRAEYPGDE